MAGLDLRLYLVTDPTMVGDRDLGDIVEAAIDGGVTVVQLRDKGASTRELVETARALRRRCAPRGIRLLVNDRVDVALAARADGVHLGQSDLAAADARRLLGPAAVVGVSVRSVEELRAAERDGASYVAANGVWATATKTDFGSPLGLEALARLAAATDLPLVAIGGIDASNAERIARAGCAGMAVVSAIMRAPDPAEAARVLRTAFESG